MSALAEQTRHQGYSLEEEFAASFFDKSLNLILLPTEQCNLRCTYCYEDFAIGRMTPEVCAGVKRLIDRRLDGLRHLSVSWFGGEPLVARDIVEDISTHIVNASRGRADLGYTGEMTTNGSLLDVRLAEHLATLGIRSFQISLDGPQALHDSTRLSASGRGSFNQIWSNLLAIRHSSADVSILLRIHLTPENVTFMPAFLSQIRDTFLADRRFTVFLKPVERMGGPNNSNISVIAEDDRSRILATLQAVVRRSADAQEIFAGDKICYAARANSLLIRADGRIGKCTVALSDPINTIGQLLPDGSLQIDNAVLRMWLQGWETGDRAVLGCPYASIKHNQPIANSAN
jgi:uncharacterized protein